ncbi:hypothetical protein V8V91_08490 [Algoriphagus halophilus]|uniref:hypothetical protein n=1 Tax=Algoriphagus halophilus TaxID=226505 RepID=UPI00358FFDA6
MLKVSDILYTSWEEIPFRKLKVILQILPLIRWDNHTSASNTYAKNFLLKQLFKSKNLPRHYSGAAGGSIHPGARMDSGIQHAFPHQILPAGK